MKLSLLDQAVILATQAHAGQTSQDGEPYIVHPLRVMLELKDEDARIVAVLHDVVEDTAVNLADLEAEGFPRDVILAVEAISRKWDEPYETYMARVALNPLAVQVKLHDLMDNWRLLDTLAPERAEIWRERYKKYIPKFRALASRK